ncbi:MAG: YggT family protein [Acidimicrobiales bacterium]|jgi:YggT family protein
MLIGIIRLVCLLFLISLWARMILSYVSVMPGSGLESFNRVMVAITDPVLLPVRRVIPPARIGGGALDLSPLVVSIAVIIVINLL